VHPATPILGGGRLLQSCTPAATAVDPKSTEVDSLYVSKHLPTVSGSVFQGHVDGGHTFVVVLIYICNMSGDNVNCKYLCELNMYVVLHYGIL